MDRVSLKNTIHDSYMYEIDMRYKCLGNANSFEKVKDVPFH